MGAPPAESNSSTPPAAAPKKRAACDECRTRKLKCSGEQPRCERCERENVTCVYSVQKQMGRPRKRRREETAPEEAADEYADGDADFDALADINFDSLQLHHGTDPLGLGDNHSQDSGVGLSSLPSEDLLGALQQPGAPFISLAPEVALPEVSYPLTEVEQRGFTSRGSLPSPPDPPAPASKPQGPACRLDPTGPIRGHPALPPIDLSATLMPPCGCLANLYLTLSDLQGLASFCFPFVLPHLRNAASVANGVVDCPVCPQSGASIMQNTFMLSTLLSAISERTSRVLKEIDDEADRCEAADVTKPFRMGDVSPGSEYRHTGTLDCPVGFNVELGAVEWRRLAKKVVKAQFTGQSSGAVSVPGLIQRLRDRQTRWHADPEMEKKHQDLFGVRGSCQPDGTGEYTCLRMVKTISTMVEGLDWKC